MTGFAKSTVFNFAQSSKQGRILNVGRTSPIATERTSATTPTMSERLRQTGLYTSTIPKKITD
jgi:hypothetical protein